MDEVDSSQRAGPSSEPEADQELMDLLDNTSPRFRSLRRGEVVEGVVVQVSRDEILVDIGTKAEAVIPASESGASPNDLLSAVKVGETILAMVVEPEDREGHALLSLSQAQAERGWRTLQQASEDGATVDGEVVDFNRGGLIVLVAGLRGFVPLSQVVDLRQAGAPDEAVEVRLERMKNRPMAVKVIEINRRRNRLILSERAAEQERRSKQRDQLIEDLKESEVRTGRISSVCDFGAFVDLGGADGLVHLTELSWSPVGHPSQVVQVGDTVDVLVLGVDREKKKIALSLKRLRSEPWQDIAQKYSIGQIVSARVTKLATFGAFAEIEPGLEGLIHISELSDERIQHPRSVVHEGEVVPVKVIRIEPERRRLGLSLRQARSEAEEAETADLPLVYGDTSDSDTGSSDNWMGGARVIRSDPQDEPPPPANDTDPEPSANDTDPEPTSHSW